MSNNKNVKKTIINKLIDKNEKKVKYKISKKTNEKLKNNLADKIYYVITDIKTGNIENTNRERTYK